MKKLIRLLYVPYFITILIIAYVVWVVKGTPFDDSLTKMDDWYCDKM